MKATSGLVGSQGEVRRPDRLVRFLRVLDLRLVPARTAVIRVPIHSPDRATRFLQRLVRQGRRVGPVIGDHAGIEQFLRRRHRPVGGEPEFPVGFLLQRRGGERRGRVLRHGLFLHPRDLPGDRASQRFRQRRGTRPVEHRNVPVPQLPRGGIEILPDGDTLPVHSNERRRELPALPAQRRLEVPESGFPEGLALLLPLDDQPHGDALHATRTQFWRDPFPKNRRHLVPEETIQDPSALLRIHQVAIDLAGMFDRAENRFFRDLMEHDAANRHLRLQQFEEMPADGLPLPVRIGRKENFRRVLQGGLHVTDGTPAVRRDDVIRLEIVFDVHRHRTPFLAFDRFRYLAGVVRKVANVADARHDAIPVSQEAGKGPGLRGGLDDQ